MSQNIHQLLVPGTQRPVIIGEYPYYRADPANWRANLLSLRELGLDVLSCYVPWRFHEVIAEDGSRSFDFRGEAAPDQTALGQVASGQTASALPGNPQHNLLGFIALAHEAGLKVLLKPGPFIHAEVRLGGLPERLCDGRYPAYHGLAGKTLTAEGLALPSFADPGVRAEVQSWIDALVQQVITPQLHPAGPITALQVGNEGICGDGNIAITAQDSAPAARAQFLAALDDGRLGPVAAEFAAAATDDSAVWPVALRRAWSQWAGQGLVGFWDWLTGLFPAGVPTVANVPLAPLDSAEPRLDAWAARMRAITGSAHAVGHTEWVGNPANTSAAFAAHLAGIALAQTDVLEANWGFTWTDPSYATASIPVANALLGLALGSNTVSVYTACATSTWNQSIAMDPAGLRAEGVDPAWHEAPYTPGAPLAEAGSVQPTAAGLVQLREFLADWGETLAQSTLAPAAVIAVDRAFADAGAWQRGDGTASGPTVLEELAEAIRNTLFRSGHLFELRWSEEAPRAAARITVSRAADDGTSGEAAEPLPGAAAQLELPADAAPSGRVAQFLEQLAATLPAPGFRSANSSSALISRHSPTHGVLIHTVFNPSDSADSVTVQLGPDTECSLSLAAHSAAACIVRDGLLLAVSGAVEQQRQPVHG